MNVKSSFSIREFLTGILAATSTTATDRNMLVHSDILHIRLPACDRHSWLHLLPSASRPVGCRRRSHIEVDSYRLVWGKSVDTILFRPQFRTRACPDMRSRIGWRVVGCYRLERHLLDIVPDRRIAHRHFILLHRIVGSRKPPDWERGSNDNRLQRSHAQLPIHALCPCSSVRYGSDVHLYRSVTICLPSAFRGLSASVWSLFRCQCQNCECMAEPGETAEQESPFGRFIDRWSFGKRFQFFFGQMFFFGLLLADSVFPFQRLNYH